MCDPTIARFPQEDTYPGEPNDPLSLNLYTYTKNNPLIFIDSTGHRPIMGDDPYDEIWTKKKGEWVYKGSRKAERLKKKIYTTDEVTGQRIVNQDFWQDDKFFEGMWWQDDAKRELAYSLLEMEADTNGSILIQEAANSHKMNAIASLVCARRKGYTTEELLNSAMDILAANGRAFDDRHLYPEDINIFKAEEDKLWPSLEADYVLETMGADDMMDMWIYAVLGMTYFKSHELKDDINSGKYIYDEPNPSEWTESNQTLFRGERSSATPDVTFEQGFTTKGTHNSLEQHVTSNSTAGDFISATSEKEIANQFEGKNGYVYEIELQIMLM